MITLDEVADFVAGLPEAIEADRRGSRIWGVRGKTFAWERQFSKADVRRFGDEPVPVGPILAVRTADLNEKEAVLAAANLGVFTIPHFDGFAAVLLQLPRVSKKVARELLTEAWLALAPSELAQRRRSTR